MQQFESLRRSFFGEISTLELSREVAGGLATLREPSPRLCTDPIRFRANRLTWERRGQPMWDFTPFRACDALALYHDFDPDLLGLGKFDFGYFNELYSQLEGEPDHVIRQFGRQLVQLRRDISKGVLRVERVEPDPSWSITTLTAFLEYVRGRPVIADGLADAQPDYGDGIPPWRCAHRTQKLRSLISAHSLYATPVEGGTYVPGDPRTAPDVVGYLVSRGVGQALAKQIASILRPEDLPKGRPRTK